MSFWIPGSNESDDLYYEGLSWILALFFLFGEMFISSIVSDELDEELSWTIVDPRVTSRGPSSLPECLSLSVRFWQDSDVGATNEIKTLALLPSLSRCVSKSNPSLAASVKIYVEIGSNLGRISFANVIKSLSPVADSDLINRGSWWMAGTGQLENNDIEVTHGKSHIGNRLTSNKGSKEMWMTFLFLFRACE
jgi:hypothetical protein